MFELVHTSASACLFAEQTNKRLDGSVRNLTMIHGRTDRRVWGCVCHLFKHCHSVPAVDHPGTEVGCRRRFVVFTRFFHKLTDGQYFRHVEFERAEYFREVPMGSDGFGHSGSDWARRVSLTTPEEPVRCWAEPLRQDRAFTHTGSLSKLFYFVMA